MNSQTLRRLRTPDHLESEMLAFLGTCYSAEEIARFHGYYRGHSAEQIQEEVARLHPECEYSQIEQSNLLYLMQALAKPLSTSERSSMRSSVFSVLSSFSAISLNSQSSMEDASASRDSYVDSARGSRYYDPYCTSGNTPVSSQVSQRDHDSPCIGLPTPSPCAEGDGELIVCIACRKKFRSATAYSRHRKEECESEGVYACYESTNHRQDFKRQEAVKEHFKIHHPEAKFTKAAAFRPHPTKKSWPCPVCKTCFDSIEAWQRDEKSHHKDVIWGDEKANDVIITGWSKQNQIQSMLFHSTPFQAAASKYIWNGCSLNLEDELHRRLMFVLQRQTLPEGVAAHRLYTGLNLVDQIVDYTFRLLLSGRPDAPPSLEPYRRRWPLQAIYPARSASLAPSREQKHANNAKYGPGIRYSPDSPYQIQQSAVVRSHQTSQGAPQQPHEVLPTAEYDVQPHGSPQRLHGSSPENQRSKSGGSIKGFLRRERSRSNLNHLEDTSSIPPVPALPQRIPARHTHDHDHDSWYDDTASVKSIRLDARDYHVASGEGNVGNTVHHSSTMQQTTECPDADQSHRMSWVASPTLVAGLHAIDFTGQEQLPTAGEYEAFATFTRNDDWKNPVG